MGRVELTGCLGFKCSSLRWLASDFFGEETILDVAGVDNARCGFPGRELTGRGRSVLMVRLRVRRVSCSCLFGVTGESIGGRSRLLDASRGEADNGTGIFSSKLGIGGVGEAAVTASGSGEDAMPRSRLLNVWKEPSPSSGVVVREVLLDRSCVRCDGDTER
jgi:hypothetical protein